MIRQGFIKKIAATASLVLMLVFALPSTVFASASLYFSPASGSYKLGKTFSVGVYVSSPSQSSNAYSGNISFDQDVLNVTSVSKAGSIITIWAKDPSYSNSSGSISFEGIVTNPGYTGSAGKLITITFTSRSAGNGNVHFVAGSVLANDGQGTNIVSGLGSANFTIEGATNTPAEPAPVESGLPAAPKINSTTHPDQNSWYKDQDPKFTWNLPSGVNAVNFFGDHSPDTDPGTSSDGLISSYSYSNVADGTWYFHLKFRNAKGWGPTGHYKFQIDNANPTFQLNSANNSTDGKIFIKGEDSLSGIDHYQVQIDSGAVEQWSDNAEHIYQAKDLTDGSHKISVTALDKAGNSVKKDLSFEYKTIAKELPEKTVSIDYPKIAKYSLAGLIALLLLGLVYWLWRKALVLLPVIFTSTRRIGLKAVALESIEMLERAGGHRQLTREEEKVLHNLRRALYGSAILQTAKREKNQAIEGVFDGQNMIGSDGKVYEVPANYSSKSKMIEGDKLRLAVSKDGSYVYKQVGPVHRQKKRGILGEQDDGEIRVIADGHAYKVSPATLMYYNAEPGDEVEVIVPKDGFAEWAAIQKVSKKKVESKETPLKRYKRTKRS